MNMFTNLKASRQLVMVYVIYEIIGSEFKKCYFKNQMEEKKLRINFMLESKKRQEDLEERVIKIFEKSDLNLSDLKCVVTHHVLRNHTYVLRFNTYIKDISVVIDKNGRFSISIIDL